MKQHNPAKKSSRRSFTKSFACAFAAAPFVPTYGASPQPGAELTAPALLSNATPIILPPVNFIEHIPPIEISDGSLEVQAVNLGKPSSIIDGFRYTADISGNYSLDRVKLIAIYESKHLGANIVQQWDRYLSGPNASVKISLEYETSPMSGVYKPVNNDRPQIVIKSEIVGSNSRLILESDKDLGDGKNTHMTTDFQRKKYWHPGYENALFRISKVEVDGTDQFPQLPSDEDHKERYKVIVLIWRKPGP
jgi:hypothetical protein